MEKDNKKMDLTTSNLLVLYKHYKDYLLPIGVILVCILIIFFVVIPQFSHYFQLQQELKAETEKLEALKNNYNFLSNLDEIKAKSELDALALALPPGKDFAGVMNAISIVSAKTGVSVGDFEFSLGNLSELSQGVTAYPSIKIEISLTGSSKSIMEFVSQLYKTVPVGEVTSVKTTGNSGALTILFYYKPYPPQAVDDAAPIIFLSNQELALVKEVLTWNNAASQSLIPFIPSIYSTPSAEAASPSGSNSSPF